MSSMVRASWPISAGPPVRNGRGEIALAEPHGRSGQRLGGLRDAPAQQHAGEQRQHAEHDGREDQQAHCSARTLAVHVPRKRARVSISTMPSPVAENTG